MLQRLSITFDHFEELLLQAKSDKSFFGPSQIAIRFTDLYRWNNFQIKNLLFYVGANLTQKRTNIWNTAEHEFSNPKGTE